MRSAGMEVRATAGALRGREVDGLAVFRGIPFAQPPVGTLCFAAPRPVPPREGIREAADAAYDGAVPARHGVVVVTFNYRVGMEVSRRSRVLPSTVVRSTGSPDRRPRPGPPSPPTAIPAGPRTRTAGG